MIKYFYLTFLLALYSNVFAQDIDHGRVAFYPFSGTANDIIGNNNGSLHGVSLAPDRFGNDDNAFQFDGYSDYIEIPHHSAINFGAEDDFTISLWVKIDKVQNDMAGTNSGILNKWSEHTASSYPYSIRYWNEKESSARAKRIFVLRYDSQHCGNNPIVTSTCEIVSEDWHHVVLLKKDTEILYYQDGVLQGVELDNTSSTCDTKNTSPVLIGKRFGNQRYFNGLIDDISFYNRALSQEEIFILYTEGGWEPIVPSDETEILSFSFVEQVKPAVIDALQRSIDVEVPCEVDLTNLVAHFTTSTGATASVKGIEQVSGVSSNDFSQPVEYQILGQQGCVQQTWTVRVTKELINQEELDSITSFQSFHLPGQKGNSIIDYNSQDIRIVMPCGVDLSNLVAHFTTSTGATASVKGIEQVSGVSSNDFSQPVEYQILGQQGCVQQTWTVRVTKELINQEELDSITAFQSFHLPGQKGNSIIDYNSQDIRIVMPCGVDVTSLISYFNLPKEATVEVNGNVQKSGITANDFSDTLVYMVSDDQDCMVKEWKVSVYLEKAFDNIDFLSTEFFLPNVITPNGDHLNDSFQVQEFLLGSEVSFYNIYGRRVYYNKTYFNDFTGKNLSSGVYYYTIRNHCIEELIKGYLHILKK